jgi:uncharacterized membrane protein YjfL (UPF0719 family)
MPENWQNLAGIAAVVVFVVHDMLVSGLHENIPVDGQATSVGVGLALLAAIGVYINAQVYESQM